MLQVRETIILPLYVEALSLPGLMQRKLMRPQPALHHNQTQAFYEYSPFCGSKKRNFVGSKMQLTLQVNGTHTCTFKLDTGAEANILPFDLYKQVCSLLLRPTSTLLCGFGNAVN